MLIPRVRLGSSGVEIAPIGVGTWAWGERRYWGYETEFTSADVVDAFVESTDAGLDFFDTAEVYADGESERILGYMARRRGGALVLASKFGLTPGRDARSVPHALAMTLRRLGVPRLDLYQIHWPDRAVASIDSLMERLADAVDAGKVRAVGVSNFGAEEMRAAHAALARRGVPLASNQVRYSLLDRSVETNGVLDACRELGVTLLAYSPLAQGLLSGKYDANHFPTGPRAGHAEFRRDNRVLAESLVRTMREVGSAHGGRPPEQVALAWLRARPGVVPIAGAKTGAQARLNAGAIDLALSVAEVETLDRASVAWLAPLG